MKRSTFKYVLVAMLVLAVAAVRRKIITHAIQESFRHAIQESFHIEVSDALKSKQFRHTYCKEADGTLVVDGVRK